VKKTIWKLREAKAKKVALQFPEGLLMYACVISDIVQEFTGAEPIMLGDVTYGACCVDDLSAKALGADFMVHYGHSCLVPIDVTNINILYIFVDITIDTEHLVACVKKTIPSDTKLAVMGTIQFASSIYKCKKDFEQYFPDVRVPQAKPLSPGEVLGCTSPVFEDREALVFVADGRFHLESAMIHNPSVTAYRYDPYAKVLSHESYDTDQMKAVRKGAIRKASGARSFGIILGTLGRQGNTSLLQRVEAMLKEKGLEYIILLLSEIQPSKLALFQDIDAWIQIACPRLSIDWGYAFKRPLLSPYEAEVALQKTEWRDLYPMDYYSKGSGSWTNYHQEETEKK
jgi:2-(3-amino-3-carboxypropyl)histidine synthase